MTGAPSRGPGPPGGHAHRLSPSTHTLEMAQLAELEERLGAGPPPTAADLGLEGAPVHGRPGHRLVAGAVLTQVVWAGAPAFPDVHAVFAEGPGGPGRLVVDLHTPALRALSSRLGLRHVWGVGPSASGSNGPTPGRRPERAWSSRRTEGGTA